MSNIKTPIEILSEFTGYDIERVKSFKSGIHITVRDAEKAVIKYHDQFKPELLSGEEIEKEAQEFILDNNCGNIVLNEHHYRENTPENAKKWIYVSDMILMFIKHYRDKLNKTQ